jgi:Tfp pilus assembly protein PilX
MTGHRQTISRSPRERGIAMLMVVIAVAVVVVLSVAFLTAQSTNTGIAQNVIAHSKARQIAESAVEMTVAEIVRDPTWRTTKANGVWASDRQYAGGLYSVTVQDGVPSTLTGLVTGDGDLANDPSQPFTITATGTHDGVAYQNFVVLRPIDTGNVNFDILSKAVVPNEDVEAHTNVLGAAITYGGMYNMPVTVRFTIAGANFEPYGPYGSPVSGNVNNGSTPAFQFPGTFTAGSTINFKARTWMKKNSSSLGLLDSDWQVYNEVDAHTNPDHIIVLRDGDDLPHISAFDGQASIATFIHDYVNTDTGKVTLGPNQAIVLVEFGLTLNTSAADFQDLVMLLDLSKPESITSGQTVVGGATNTLNTTTGSFLNVVGDVVTDVAGTSYQVQWLPKK